MESAARAAPDLRSWAPKVLMCQAIGKLGGFLERIEVVVSFIHFTKVYDKETS